MIEVMTWEKFKKQNNAEVDWIKDYYGFRDYGETYKYYNDSKTVAEVVKAYVEDRTSADGEQISTVVYKSKPRGGWGKKSYKIEIWVK